MDAASAPAELAARVARLLGRAPIAWRRVTRGYTRAERWVARFADGTSCFVKGAVDAPTATWLETENRVYGALRAAVLPKRLAWEGGPLPLLVLEDLSDAQWPPPWGPERIAAMRRALDDLHACAPPDGLPSAEAERAHLDGWPRVAVDPRPFLTLGLASPAWLERALPALRSASEAAVLTGEATLHFDVRSDNVAFLDGQPRIVDWNWACRGHPDLDLAGWLPSLATEGGPEPDEIWTAGPEVPALLAGYFSSVAGLPPPWPGSTVRALQVAQARVALPWAARALRLPPPGSST